uniref:Putative secreted protein n=1 Tax=Anopheles marajoara TaxID=58244 RepID=A0A2M4CD60_9DIPT
MLCPELSCSCCLLGHVLRAARGRHSQPTAKERVLLNFLANRNRGSGVRIAGKRRRSTFFTASCCRRQPIGSVN